jgi:hypothetical protein
MTNELTTTKTLTASDIRAQVNLIQEVMKAVMKNGTHYGTIPGTQKPTLFKAGAEKVLMTFQLVSGDPKIEDLSISDLVRYRVTVPILTRSGTLVGCGTGECSSDEEKYKWRRPVCDEEFDATPENKRREKWFKGKEKPYSQKQVRTSPADVANTVLKMAHKRGLVAGTLVTTAASDVFDQDLEDMPEEMIHRDERREPVAMPHAKEHTATGVECVTGKVDEVSHKDATKTSAARYGIMIGGAWYSTFSESFAKIATDAKESDVEVKVGYKVNGAYKNVESIEVVIG